ncbi:MAG: DNA polymerase III subunit delta [Muribaculaceae bacterium]|nr:DNA polymerase III subunit delta [Muribaculaceae bacterium]
MRFADIIGHEGVKTRLRDMVDADRLPHALLLSGPAGVGKLAMARAMAQYLHCRNPHDGDSCGVCPACVQHQSLNNADMHFTFPYVKKKSEGLLNCNDYAPQWRQFLALGNYGTWEQWLDISKSGNSQPVIYVDESAEIVRRMNISNYSARYKIALIWLPERLQPEAANKLLKIIEEPFDDTKFIMVSNDPSGILPTIYSRAQRVEMPRLETSLIAATLSEHYAVDKVYAPQIANRAEGSMATAISLIGTEGEQQEFAPIFRDMMRKAYSRDVRSLRDIGDNVAGFGREKNRRFLRYCCQQLRENFIYNLHEPALLQMDREELQFSSRFAPFVNAANVEEMLTLFTDAEEDIGRNASAKIVMFDTMIHLIASIIKKPTL